MCEIDPFFDATAEVWNERTVRARTGHRCDCCRGPILAGSRYLRHFSVFDGGPTFERACSDCAAMIGAFTDEHGVSFNPSQMPHALRDCVQEEKREGRRSIAARWMREIRAMYHRRQNRGAPLDNTT